MVKILVTEPEYFDDDAIRTLRKVGKVEAARLRRKQLERKIEDVDVLVTRIEERLDKGLLGKARKLAIIGSATTGLNHIDVKYADKRGIKIISLHGTHTVPTAEHAFALILSLSRRIPWAYESLRRGRWRRYDFFGVQLEGKTLGVIGLGRIGKMVARYGKAFGMRVMAFDPYVRSAEFEMVPLERLLRNSDVITIHAMLTDETEGMIGSREFRMMKNTALLVNTARAEIVKQEALLGALDRGIIRGAAVDVFPKEPLEDREDPMVRYARKRDNLIITPHIAASTYDAIHEAGLEIAEGIVKAVGSRAK